MASGGAMKGTTGLLVVAAVVVGLGIWQVTYDNAPKPGQYDKETASLITTQAHDSPQAVAVRKAAAKRAAAELARWQKSPAGRLLRSHNSWTIEECNLIAGHHVRIGMTKEQVKAAWGSPDRVNNQYTVNTGNLDQWVYADGDRYLYFLNGVLAGFQSTE